MVKKIILFLVLAFYLVACNPATKSGDEGKDKEYTVFEEKMTEQEKEQVDEEFFQSLEKVKISEEGFFFIVKYVIETAKKSDFKELDPILGKKEKMYSKDFKDPYISYHYVQIPHYPEIEVYLKYRKKDNKLIFISLGYPGSAGGFSFSGYKLRTLDQLNLKVIKKSSLYYSNQLFEYQLTDGKLRYEVYGKDNIDNEPPKEFYIFRIYLD